jgi:hypothetical protein
MAERRLIFSAKGNRAQIGYIEGNEVFDLSGRRRGHYTGATGNVCDSSSGTIVGHVSLEGKFVGATWIADELFGQPNREARAARSTARMPSPSSSEEGKPAGRVGLAAAGVSVIAARDAAAHSQSLFKSGGDPGTPLSTSENISDQLTPQALPMVPHQEPIVRAPDPNESSLTENELLDSALKMIRSGLEKAPE